MDKHENATQYIFTHVKILKILNPRLDKKWNLYIEILVHKRKIKIKL